MSIIYFFTTILREQKRLNEIEEFLLEFPEEERDVIRRICLS
mgnify:CR=1 FL=1|jgi:hypothetical protein